MATWVAMRALAPATGSGFATPASRPRRQMATWVAMAALEEMGQMEAMVRPRRQMEAMVDMAQTAFEVREAPSVRPGQLEEMASMPT